jgi:hypothetical protein
MMNGLRQAGYRLQSGKRAGVVFRITPGLAELTCDNAASRDPGLSEIAKTADRVLCAAVPPHKQLIDIRIRRRLTATAGRPAMVRPEQQAADAPALPVQGRAGKRDTEGLARFAKQGRDVISGIRYLTP